MDSDIFWIGMVEDIRDQKMYHAFVDGRVREVYFPVGKPHRECLRVIADLERQLSRLAQLAETVDDPQPINTEIVELRRNLNNAQTKYERECL